MRIDINIFQAVHEAVEEEKRKAKRVISKQELIIKALEKQLTDERSARSDQEKASGNMKKTIEEIEGKYKFEVSFLISFFQS
jgi:hypothetical protein